MFTIDSLEILSECDKSLRKNIKPGTYYFNNKHEGTDSVINKVPNFWGENINVQAIVGKNGSGKSTLMDLMYMAINNFSYMFERGNKRKRPGAKEMYFVPGLQVKVHFSTDNGEYTLECNKKSVQLKNKNGIESCPNLTLYEKDSPNEEKYTKRYDTDQKIASLVKDFFYTIVSNYSMQSFVDENYKTDIYQYWDEEDCKEVERYTSEYLPNHDYPKSNYSWISPIFHKNDGYVRSIVLNPYRDDGTVNLENEYELSKDRVCSLFLYSKIVGNKFFGKYEFEKLNIGFLETHSNVSLSHSMKYVLSDWMSEPEYEYFRNIEFSSDAFINHSFEEPFAKKILEKFDIQEVTKFKESRRKCAKAAVAYIQYKILKMILRYRDYSEFRDVFHIKVIPGSNSGLGEKEIIFTEKIYIEICTNKETKCDDLLTKILNDKSHITKKIRRTINFLKLDLGIIPEFKQDDKGRPWFYTGIFHLDDFTKKFDHKSVFFNKNGDFDSSNIKNWISPQIIDDCLPPPIFDWKLILNKYDENEEIIKVDKDEIGNIYEKCENGKYKKNGIEIDAKEVPNLEIPYNQLSSGEIQFLQTISIHTYHTMNLISVPDDNNHPKYKNFNLVFDEVEICFHPEMQRQFLNKLITVLKDMKANIGNSINIFIITHSPFILSDIPASNVLFLKDGRPDNEAKKRITFAENIGEMMYDSFFMEKTIGDFAESKLKELIKKRQGKTTNMSDEEAKFILDSIGDPVIKSLIEEVEPLQND
ncbi:MAG: AAA family ATPase [Fibrobacter sp.]|nr:AAA family ATPase [Fibrobacter sp.]